MGRRDCTLVIKAVFDLDDDLYINYTERPPFSLINVNVRIGSVLMDHIGIFISTNRNQSIKTVETHRDKISRKKERKTNDCVMMPRQ